MRYVINYVDSVFGYIFNDIFDEQGEYHRAVETQIATGWELLKTVELDNITLVTVLKRELGE